MFGDRLKEIRKSKGLSQKDLAEKLNVTQQTISHFESGDKIPKIETIKRIAVALEVPPSDLDPGFFGDFQTYNEIHTALFGKEITPEEYREDQTIRKIAGLARKLNETGQGKVIDYASDLSKIPEYQAAAAPDPEDREPPETEKDPHI